MEKVKEKQNGSSIPNPSIHFASQNTQGDRDSENCVADKSGPAQYSPGVDESPKNLAKPFSYWLKKNWYYHKQVIKFYQFMIPQGASVLHMNCKNGYLLDALKPSLGVGIDEDETCIADAQKQYAAYQFYHGSIESALDTLSGENNKSSTSPQFDYIILSLVTMEADDIQALLTKLRIVCHARTRIILDSYSYAWEPILWITQKIGLRRPTKFKNWISCADMHNFLYLAGFESVTQGQFMIMPKYIPFFSWLCNSMLSHVPLIKHVCLIKWVVARPVPQVITDNNVTVSVIIPCKNEKGNIERAVRECPQMGAGTEIIFVEGGSRDGTQEEIKRVAKLYPEKKVLFLVQDGKGKGDAVRKGFAHATGDILMILDADLTVPPEELPKFFAVLVSGKSELVNGSRLVYAMETGAMRFLNLLANFFFSVLFSWLLGQRVKDTLCGTKVLWRNDYERIAANRHFFGDFDPFGDFDLLFGAAKLQLKIIDLPVHYKNRAYGQTQIRRFLHGWILLGMSFIALKKFKLR